MTGSSSGIGRAFARALGERGVNVVLVARDRARLEEVAREIETAGAEAEILVADLADPEALARVEERLARGSPIDLFVNNAALGATGRFVDVDVEAAEQQVRFDASGVPGSLWQEASQVVEEALASYEAGRPFCVPGGHNRTAVALSHLVPYRWVGRFAGLLARLNPRPSAS